MKPATEMQQTHRNYMTNEFNLGRWGDSKRNISQQSPPWYTTSPLKYNSAMSNNMTV